jgi:hypothetical protein
MSALASDFHIARSCIFTRLTAICFAGGNHTAAGDVRTSLLLDVRHKWSPFLLTMDAKATTTPDKDASRYSLTRLPLSAKPISFH